jgi:hypothetical protein
MEPLAPALIAGAILAALVLLPLLIALFQWLWNITMPQVFGLNVITFWQAFRLLIIAAFLFGTGEAYDGHH